MTYVFETVDDPFGALGTTASGVDGKGQIVGYYVDSSGSVHSYIDTGGVFTTIGTINTVINGINSSGIIAVGEIVNGPHSIPIECVQYQESDLFALSGVISKKYGAPEDLTVNGINYYDVYVGSFVDADGHQHGYKWTRTGGLKILDDPNDAAGPNGTVAVGINDKGQIVGGYFDSTGLEHGFLYFKGKWTTLDDPLGALGTECDGINNKGQIVGHYYDKTGLEHGFIATEVNGQHVFTTVDDPLGVNGTAAFGINKHGEIVGIYYDANNVEHGFHT